jgi:hypothetical protein
LVGLFLSGIKLFCPFYQEMGVEDIRELSSFNSEFDLIYGEDDDAIIEIINEWKCE